MWKTHLLICWKKMSVQQAHGTDYMVRQRFSVYLRVLILLVATRIKFARTFISLEKYKYLSLYLVITQLYFHVAYSLHAVPFADCDAIVSCTWSGAASFSHFSLRTFQRHALQTRQSWHELSRCGMLVKFEINPTFASFYTSTSNIQVNM